MPKGKNLVTIFSCFAVLALVGYLRSDSAAGTPRSDNARMLETLQEKVCSHVRTREYTSREKKHFDALDATLNIYTTGRDELEKAIANEDFDEYYKWLLLVAIPWIVLACLSWAFVKFLFLWWCCPGCIPCKRWRREQTTLTAAQDKKYSCALLVLSVLIIIFLVVALILSPHAYRGAKKTVCSSFSFTDRILDGDSSVTQNFQGFRKLKQPMEDVVALAPQANAAMARAMEDNSTHNTMWAKDYLSKLDQIENNIQGFKNSYSIPSPNPATPAATYSSIYIDSV